MNPWQLAKDSESSQQIALFCWAAYAQKFGFLIANDIANWGMVRNLSSGDIIPELKWLHHIPNGGSRGDNAKSRMIAGGQLKAEGVRSGVLDIFWPYVKYDQNAEFDNQIRFAGLYIEMKRPAEKRPKDFSAGCSDAQREFGEFAHNQGYYVTVCYSWLEAAKVIQDYYEGKL